MPSPLMILSLVGLGIFSIVLLFCFLADFPYNKKENLKHFLFFSIPFSVLLTWLLVANSQELTAEKVTYYKVMTLEDKSQVCIVDGQMVNLNFKLGKVITTEKIRRIVWTQWYFGIWYPIAATFDLEEK